MKATIVYDNGVIKSGLRAGWGFSALIESDKAVSILFDTGADGPTLLQNMEELGIDAGGIGIIEMSKYAG